MPISPDAAKTEYNVLASSFGPATFAKSLSPKITNSERIPSLTKWHSLPPETAPFFNLCELLVPHSSSATHINALPIPHSSSIFVYILKYASTFDTIKNYTSDYIKLKKYEKDIDKKYEVILKLPYGKSSINYNGNEIKINYKIDDESVGLSHSATKYESLKITTNKNIDILKKFIRDAYHHCNPSYSDYVIIKTFKN